MKKVLSVSFGELTLKKSNRRKFELQATKKIRRALRDFPVSRIAMDSGKLYIEAPPEHYEKMMDKIIKIFGVSFVCPCLCVEKNMEAIEEGLVAHLEEQNFSSGMTFKVKTTRVDKDFTPQTPELNRIFGDYVLSHFDLRVDVHHPEQYVYVDIKTKVYIYTRRIKGLGGLPVGSVGNGMLLLSGGIDSPVAGYRIAGRGVHVSAIHFHSYPFTSDRGFDKVKRLATKLSDYTGPFTLYSVNLLPIQTEISKHCPEREMTILARRFMMRIAQLVAKQQHCSVLITGESLGQVASQTIEGLQATDACVDMLVVRPLIGMDKDEIIQTAKFIETFETSIEPFEDCCTVFLPKRPKTKPRLEDIERSESALDVDALIQDAVEGMEIIPIGFED